MFWLLGLQTHTHTFLETQRHSMLHKPTLTVSPSAPQQPEGFLRSRSAHHPVHDTAHGTVSQSQTVHIYNNFHCQTCYFKRNYCAKAETNSSLVYEIVFLISYNSAYANVNVLILDFSVEFLTSSLVCWRAWGCTEGVWRATLQKPPSGVGAWCCSPWQIVSLDYWIIREHVTQ